MYLSIVLALATLLVFLLGLTVAAKEGQNLISSSSFEQGFGVPVDWQVWGAEGATLKIDDTVSHTGVASGQISIAPEGASQYPGFGYFVDGVTPGDKYSASVWAKTRDMTGLGGYIVIAFFKADKRLSYAEGDFTGTGDNDWMQLSVEAFVPEGADRLALVLNANGVGTVWFDDAVLVRTAEAPVEFSGKEVKIEVCTSQTTGVNLLGFGAQGDFLLTRDINTIHGVGPRDRELVFRRVEEMRPHILRTFFDYKWWEPSEGVKTPESQEIQDYLYWVRFLKSIGTSVLLTPWGDYFAYSDWMLDGKARLPVPDKREAMVRSLVDFVEFLRRDQGLDNVEYLCLMNEPDNDPRTTPEVEEYVELNRLLDKKLRERGLRDEIFLLGVDDCRGGPATITKWYRDVISEGLEYADGVSAHTYVHGYVPPLESWVKTRIDLVNGNDLGRQAKPLLITEFGNITEYTDPYSNNENHKYDYGLFLADFAVTALRAGASGALAWCMMDVYYDQQNMQKGGLWRFKDTGWKPRPGFYTWSLITRYTRPDSQVLLVEINPSAPSLRATALRSPVGELTVIIVNKYERHLRVTLQFEEERDSFLRVYQYTKDNVSGEGGHNGANLSLGEKEVEILKSHGYWKETVPIPTDGMIGASNTIRVTPKSSLVIEVPAESFVLLTEVY